MPSISVIDDDKDLLAVTKKLLSRCGFAVSTFFNWETAREAIRKFKPQIILLDVFLSPNTDGLDVCRELKESPATKDIPVLMCSGFPKVADSAVYEYGADDFIAKPFSGRDLVKKLYSLLQRKNNDRLAARRTFWRLPSHQFLF